MLPPPAPSAYGVPAGFDEVVRTAMAKAPEERYPSARAFAEALSAAINGSAASTRGSGGWTRRRVGKLVAIAAPVIAIGGVGATVLAQGHTQPTQLTVCAQDATVRDAPLSRTVIATVHRGDQLTPISQHDGDTWVHVRLADGRDGWSLTEFVRHQC